MIRGNDLIMVPDGPLFMAPFAAFLDPNYQHLCESLRIRLLPSLTSLKLITDSSPDYHSTKGALMVGDPCLKNIQDKARETKSALQAATLCEGGS